MALRANTNLAPHGVAVGSGSGKPAPGAEEDQQGSTAPARADSGAPEMPGTIGESAGTSETGMTQNEAFFLMSFVKEGFSNLSSRMDGSERRRKKESSTLMDFLKRNFLSLSDRMNRSGKTQEKRTEDLAQCMDRAAKAKGKRAKYLLRRLERISERELKFFIWIMGCFGVTALVLGVPLYLSFFNLG